MSGESVDAAHVRSRVAKHYCHYLHVMGESTPLLASILVTFIQTRAGDEAIIEKKKERHETARSSLPPDSGEAYTRRGRKKNKQGGRER